jgi:hypothetical protein
MRQELAPEDVRKEPPDFVATSVTNLNAEIEKRALIGDVVVVGACALQVE